MSRRWTKEEEALLHKKYIGTAKNVAELQKLLPGRTERAIRKKAYRLGLAGMGCVKKRSYKDKCTLEKILQSNERPKRRIPKHLRGAFLELVIEIAKKKALREWKEAV